MVNEPMQSLERHFPVYVFVHVESARDGLVVSCMETERPAILREQSDHRFQVLLHRRRKIRPGLEKVLEICSREHQGFASAVVPIVAIALPGLDHSRPVLEISKLCFRLLREQIVGDADRQLAILMELINYLIVFRVVLKTAACVDNTRNAKPVQLSHEMAGRIRLLLMWEYRCYWEIL